MDCSWGFPYLQGCSSVSGSAPHRTSMALANTWPAPAGEPSEQGSRDSTCRENRQPQVYPWEVLITPYNTATPEHAHMTLTPGRVCSLWTFSEPCQSIRNVSAEQWMSTLRGSPCLCRQPSSTAAQHSRGINWVHLSGNQAAHLQHLPSYWSAVPLNCRPPCQSPHLPTNSTVRSTLHNWYIRT